MKNKLSFAKDNFVYKSIKEKSKINLCVKHVNAGKIFIMYKLKKKKMNYVDVSYEIYYYKDSTTDISKH